MRGERSTPFAHLFPRCYHLNMQFNKVTWYSKVIAMILFIALTFVGFYLGVKYQERINPPTTIVVEPRNGSSTKTVVNTDQVTLKTTYENGTLKYSGTVQLPTPCHGVNHEVTVLESFPEQVQIKVTIEVPEAPVICAGVITPKEFSGEVQVSEDATVSVYLNDKKIE